MIYKVQDGYVDDSNNFTVCSDTEKIPNSCERVRCVDALNLRTGNHENIIIYHDQYKRITISSDNYPSDNNSYDKLMRNREFVNLLKRFPRPNREVVVLDTPMAQTTQMIYNADLSENIHVPNPDKDFCRDAVPHFSQMATHYDSMLFEWMRDVIDNGDTYDFAADYCCTFNGNATCKPKVDLELMMDRKLLAAHHGVLWLTFSTRGVLKSKRLSCVIDYVEKLATKYKYSLRLMISGTYGTVCYFMFVTF